jgi:2-succinyl-6-hydroxy-2,4-cyclohexadiene-1-carboxylate synthase
MESTEQTEGAPLTLGSVARGPEGADHVVLVHGFTQNSESWRHLAEALAVNYHVTTIDLPGHGRSTNIVADNFIDTAVMVGNTGGRGTYVGYSLGGRLCLGLACHAPQLIERLVLISASPGISDPVERQQRMASDDALADRLDPPEPTSEALTMDDFLDEWLAGPLFSHLSPAQQDRASRLANTTRGLGQSLRSAGVGRQPPLHDRLSSLSMPVICVAGEDDRRFVGSARSMVASIGDNAVVQLVAHSGHAVPFEQPSATLALLRRALETPHDSM